ncbi:hypothetical protein NA57DRAFT_71092 [Rhizodiscina lignyota]|uniref:Uncharacterized protein n=1 Tax=Rhizodiscina lignyota TaxID=1504668 RepID=A0A9P4MBQ2_9PEZI|nr:hypothetical protein NA57DRAFT_71092 [Rhizodiscina lignyota]
MEVPIYPARNTQHANLPARYVRPGRRQQPGPPVRINFNASRGPRYVTPRRRDMETEQSQERIDAAEAQALPSSQQMADVVLDHRLLRIPIKENNSTPSYTNETESMPQDQILDLLSDSPLGHLPRPRRCSPPLYPTPPRSRYVTPVQSPDALRTDVTPCKPKVLQHSPLRHPLEPAIPIADHLANDKPTGKRRRIPSAWVEASLTPPSHPLPPLPTIASISQDVPPAPIAMHRAPTPPLQDFRIPRKPPPIPKTRPGSKPAALSLFPSSLPSSTVSGNGTLSNDSPPSSLRSGSTLVGTTEGDVCDPPATPTTVISAQKMIEIQQASCSPGQTSGWYDDEDGIERAGLMGRWRGRKGGGWKKVLCCFAG